MRWRVILSLLLFSALTCGAATRYVEPSGSHTAPFDTWAKAATGLNVVVGSSDGDIILMSNGVYAYNQSLYTNVTWVGVNGPSTVLWDGTTGTGLPEIFQGQFYGITFANVTGQYGVIFEGTHTISNCVFTKNRNTRDGCGAVTMYGKEKVILDSVFHGNSSQYEGGGVAIAENPSTSYFVRCTISNNVAAQDGGGVYVVNGRAYFDRCTITRNQAVGLGGAVRAAPSTPINYLLLSNCVVSYNGASDNAIALRAELVQSLIFGNTCRDVAAQDVSLCSSVLIGNYCTNASYGAVYGEVGERRNSIIAYNSPRDISRGWYTNVCFKTVSSYDPPTIGPGCLSNVAPEFVDHAYYETNTTVGLTFKLGPNGLDGLRLATESPCIDAGTNQSWMATGYDYSGTNSRIQSSIVDMGAFEYVAGEAPASDSRAWRLKSPGVVGIRGGLIKW